MINKQLFCYCICGLPVPPPIILINQSLLSSKPTRPDCHSHMHIVPLSQWKCTSTFTLEVIAYLLQPTGSPEMSLSFRLSEISCLLFPTSGMFISYQDIWDTCFFLLTKFHQCKVDQLTVMWDDEIIKVPVA